jgi:periplasmic protein TonB
MSGNYRFIVSLFLCSFAWVASTSALTVAEVTDVSTSVDEPPVPLKTYVPDYPAALREAKVNGVVIVVVVIDENGTVLVAEVGKSSHEDFKEPALEAMRRWKFKAAKFEGKPVKFRATIPVRFTAA